MVKIEEILKLNVAEKISIIEKIWDSLWHEEQEEISFTLALINGLK